MFWRFLVSCWRTTFLLSVFFSVCIHTQDLFLCIRRTYNLGLIKLVTSARTICAENVQIHHLPGLPFSCLYYTTLYLELAGALLSPSTAAAVPSANSRFNSLIAFVTTSSVSPSTRIYSLGSWPAWGVFPAG